MGNRLPVVLTVSTHNSYYKLLGLLCGGAVTVSLPNSERRMIVRLAYLSIAVSMCTKHFSLPQSSLRPIASFPSTSRSASPPFTAVCLTSNIGSLKTTARRSVWRVPASTGSPSGMFSKRPPSTSSLPVPRGFPPSREIRTPRRIPNGSVTYSA